MAKDSFIFHLENAEDLEDLTLEEQGLIFAALIRYTQTGEEPEFEDRALRTAWRPIFRRLKADAEYYAEQCERNAANGSKGGAPKGNQNARKTTENNPKQPKTTENNPKQPKTSLSDTDSDSDTDTDSDVMCADAHYIAHESAAFTRFWAAYPRKVGKKDAQKAFDRAIKGGSVSADRIVAAVEEQKRWDDWIRGYIPNPATWLNQGRWEDERQKPRGEPRAKNAPSAEMSHAYDMAELARRAKE